MDKYGSGMRGGKMPMGDYEYGMKQHQNMAEGYGTMPEKSFGVSPLPGTARIKGNTKDMGRILSDSERRCGPDDYEKM